MTNTYEMRGRENLKISHNEFGKHAVFFDYQKKYLRKIEKLNILTAVVTYLSASFKSGECETACALPSFSAYNAYSAEKCNLNNRETHIMLSNSVLESIGNTPLIKLANVSSGNIFAKAEFLNPGGSVKDRVALHIIACAERDGSLKKGMTIIEATSGNTGIGLTLVGRLKGYDVICVMPDNMSEERRKIIEAFGGEILYTPAKESLPGCLAKMKKIVDADPEKYFIANQFENPCNPEIHYSSTAVEIFNDMNGEIDIFVAGVGSGGTLQGIGKFLKEKNPCVKIVAVEPKNSAALLGREPGLHQIQGIGDGFIPGVLDVDLVDMVFTVSDEEAIETTRRLSREEGLLVGTSSGANVFAALQMDNGRSRVVTILPDRAERYFSTALL